MPDLAGRPRPVQRRNASTVKRELDRNRTKTGRYNPKTADEMAHERRERIVRNTALKPGVLHMAIRLLKEKRWSPEQISGYLRLRDIHISKERIYQEIRKTPDLVQYCHHKMKHTHHQASRYMTAGRSMIPDRISIHERPAEADGTRFGDWEMDLIIGAQQKSAVLTIVERSKNILLQTKLPSKRPEDVEKTVIRQLLPYKKYVHIITTDMEFRNHKAICKALDTTVYFADLLTRNKPQDIIKIHLADSSEPRGIIIAEFSDYNMGVTHLGLGKNDRLIQIDSIQSLSRNCIKPFLLAGDFNFTPESEAFIKLAKAFKPLNDTAEKTFPADNPQETIDYIRISQRCEVEILHREVVNEPNASDHRPVVAKIVLPRQLFEHGYIQEYSDFIWLFPKLAKKGLNLLIE